MDNRRLPLALAALMLVCTPFVGASGNNDGICDGDEGPGNGRDDEGANIQCAIITGPSTLTIKSVLTVGIGFCQTETTDIPLQCEGDAGDINGAGAASFGDDDWTGQRQINVDVSLDTDACTAATSPPCGFTVEICNDRDQDSTCTNILAQNDELFDTATSEGIVFGDCKDQKKDCADPNEASWEGCMNPSIFDDDWSDDQIIIFIGAEVGPTVDLADFGGINPYNVTETILNITDFVLGSSADAQAAVAVGTFTIFVEDVGSPTGCLVQPEPVDAEPLACEGDWEVGALDGSADNPFNGASCDSGTCSDDYDGMGYPAVVTVTCFAFNACEVKDVRVTANLIANGNPMSADDNVTATVACDDVPVVSVFDNLPGNIPNTLDDIKPESGDYKCIMVFDVQTAPYSGMASCSDPPAVAPRGEPSLCTGSVRIIADVLVAGGATCEFANGANPLVCPTFKATPNTWSQVCVVAGGCEAKNVVRTADKITDIVENANVLLRSRVTVSAPCSAPGGLTIDSTANAMAVQQTSLKVVDGADPDSDPDNYVCRFNYVVNSPLNSAGTTLVYEAAAACSDNPPV